MSNYKRENLLNIAPAKVPAGTLAVKVGGDVFTAGNVKIRGTDVSGTTATQEDVVVGKYFFNNKGEFVPGLLDAALSGTGTFYKCTAVFGEDGDNILVSRATETDANGIYVLEDKTAVGFSRVWSKATNSVTGTKYIIFASDAFSVRTWVLSRGVDIQDNTWLYQTHSEDGSDVTSPWLAKWIASDSAYGNPPTVIYTETSTTPDCVTFTPSTARGSADHYYLLDDTAGMRIWQTADGERRIIQNYVRGDVKYNWAFSEVADGYWYPMATSNSTAAYPWEVSSWYDTIFQNYFTLNSDYFIKPANLPRKKYKKWSGLKATLKTRTVSKRVNSVFSFNFDSHFKFTYTYGTDPEQYIHRLYSSDLAWMANADDNLEGANRVFKSHGSPTWLVQYTDGAWYLHKAYTPNNPFKTATVARLVGPEPIGTWDTSVCSGTPPSNTIVTSTWEDWHTVDTQEYYWEFEDVISDNLDWGKGFTPQVGRIYDEEATIAAVLSEPAPGLSAPDNMTTYENDEWVVSADNEFGGTKAWNAFDGNPDSIWATRQGASYLTWQNKLRSVLVRQLEITYNADAHVNDYTHDVSLYGSNNGDDWIYIGTPPSLTYTKDSNGYAKAVMTFPDNKISYFYHKICGNMSITIRNVIGTLTAKPKIDNEYDGGME